MRRRRFLALASAGFLAGCNNRETAARFNATDITGVDWAQGFDLTKNVYHNRFQVRFSYLVVGELPRLMILTFCYALERLGNLGSRFECT